MKDGQICPVPDEELDKKNFQYNVLSGQDLAASSSWPDLSTSKVIMARNQHT